MKRDYDYAAVRLFLDEDIRFAFEKPVTDEKGEEHESSYYMSDPALTAAVLQLTRVIREAFSRGFVVEK